jgi:hypothetical protein
LRQDRLHLSGPGTLAEEGNMKKNQDRNLVPDPTSAPDNNGGKPGSKNAGGPKTPAGKRRVRFNARTHGFFSKELVVPEEDRAEFEALKDGIETHLKPASQLQQLAVERVVSAAWRHKLALRMEGRRLKPQLETDDAQDSGQSATGLPRWYTSGRQGLNIAAKGLRELREEIQTSGGLHLKDHKDWIVNTLGEDFYVSLAEWQPTH